MEKRSSTVPDALVGNDPAIIRALERVRVDSLAVRSAGSGIAALRAAEDTPPRGGLIVLDVDIPDLDKRHEVATCRRPRFPICVLPAS